MPYVIGVTGGIGSGKSAVADAFARLGVEVIDTDAIAHSLTAPGGAAVGAIRSAFGDEYIDASGALDRARMRSLAFRDPDARRRLESILHPMIRSTAETRLDRVRSPYALLVVPLLAESGALKARCQRILVVDCEESQQIDRVMRRSGLSHDEVKRIMSSQATRAERSAIADDVLDNSGPESAIGPRVAALHDSYLRMAGDALARAGGHSNPGVVAGSAAGSGCSGAGCGGQSPTSSGEAPSSAEPQVIVYEYPLNERIRTLLRLEDLFERIRHFLGGSDPLEHHAALLTLFEVLEVAGRADLKSDLLQELERQKQVLASFRGSPDIAEDVLTQVLTDIEHSAAALFAMTGKIGQYLRENEWLMSIKQRTGIPGGACEFDLPSYHYWLHRSSEARLSDLLAWITPLYPIRDGTAIVLRLLREGGRPTRQVATAGTFSQMLGGKTAQMVRIRLPRESELIPEISANKYALNVRFTTFGTDPRPRLTEKDVEFDLSFCNL